MGPTLDISMYSGPIFVTSAYFLLWYYLLLGVQRGTKYRLIAEYEAEGKVFDRYFGQDEQMLAADRAVANTQEQMVPFLAALWLYAIFVSPSIATWLGGIYVVLRTIYPMLLGKRVSKTQTKKVGFVTTPCYLIIFYMLGALTWTALQS